MVNDAASLTVFRFASIAILTGQFAMGTATTQFLVLSVMGVVVGLVIGHILYFSCVMSLNPPVYRPRLH
ncbi:hypothetical protein KUH03_27975 [Sphingobacterium sp. E70]|uniref:hypothetical protein n=1 Tax=Sphingobacterium sp. E70 TaxID=2853439 RepID=UPI00211BA08C|nr:hypothetical protein [Sphingobacterium sp. E70]ULT23059.1 hypothetical protein KUH03_27975 [Sphingobacterium sp. E70]